MSAEVPLQRVLGLADPLKNWPWCCERPSAKELQHWLATAPLEPKQVDTNEPAIRHIGRIRYLAQHGWSDPIEIDVGIPVLGYPGPHWPLTDGNHRVAAATVRKDPMILVDISGQVDYAARLLGVDEETLIDGRQPA